MRKRRRSWDDKHGKTTLISDSEINFSFFSVAVSFFIFMMYINNINLTSKIRILIVLCYGDCRAPASLCGGVRGEVKGHRMVGRTEWHGACCAIPCNLFQVQNQTAAGDLLPKIGITS